MLIHLTHEGTSYMADLSKGINISLPLISGAKGPKCFYAPDFETEPLVAGSFVGEVAKGSPVNFRNVRVNPHGNGTHTECAGHISIEQINITETLSRYHYICRLITVEPEETDTGDKVITLQSILRGLNGQEITEALVVRTLPNEDTKKTKDYSGTNPPYFEEEVIAFLCRQGMDHLLTDLPSVDREEDGGRLAAHKTFWGWPSLAQRHRTITEMVYVDNYIRDGLYLCNIQIAPFSNDASPSTIVIFPLADKK